MFPVYPYAGKSHPGQHHLNHLTLGNHVLREKKSECSAGKFTLVKVIIIEMLVATFEEVI